MEPIQFSTLIVKWYVQIVAEIYHCYGMQKYLGNDFSVCLQVQKMKLKMFCVSNWLTI